MDHDGLEMGGIALVVVLMTLDIVFLSFFSVYSFFFLSYCNNT